MAKTFEYSMKIPFDMSDVNGFIKIPQLILLSLQVSGMQSIELGMSDMYILAVSRTRSTSTVWAC